MGKPNKRERPNLAGWAAILTAVAALLGAVGFKEFATEALSKVSSGSLSTVIEKIFIFKYPTEAPSELKRKQAVLAVPILSRTSAEPKLEKLQKYLIEKDFEEANKKTAEVMNWIAQQEEDNWIDTAEAINFDCVDLKTIDQLWRAASHEKFGLSIQRDIYQLDKNLVSFGDEVDWRINEGGTVRWKRYSELTFDLRAPKGHLPARNIDPEEGEKGSMTEGWLVYSFIDSTCFN